MPFKNFGFILILVGLVGTLHAVADESDAVTLLNAKRVNDRLEFDVAKSRVSVRVDGNTSVTLQDGRTFTSPDEVLLVYPNYNPFKILISRTENEFNDKTAAAVASFTEALVKMSQAVLPLPDKADADAAEASVPNVAANAKAQRAIVLSSARNKKGIANQWIGREILPEPAPNCRAELTKCQLTAESDNSGETDRATALGSCELLFESCHCAETASDVAEATKTLNQVKEAHLLSATEAQESIENATGKGGIVRARVKMQAVLTETAGWVTRANKALATLTDVSEDQNELNCAAGTIPIPTPAELRDYKKSVSDYIAAATKLKTSLDEIIKMLQDIEGQQWRNNDQDFIFGTAKSSPIKGKEEKVIFALQEVKLANESLSLNQTSDETRTFNVRRLRRLVPEVGVAAVFNQLEYPKYTAVADPADAAKKIVKKETDDSHVDAAMMMNFLCNCIGDETIFPGIQLGISKADKYPGLLLGLTLRLASVKQISIGTGGMVTWFKDTKTLKDNDPVADQAAIDKDLHLRRSNLEWYFAVQYNF
jgi:uncharacterized protein (UPF0147 family)